MEGEIDIYDILNADVFQWSEWVSYIHSMRVRFSPSVQFNFY